MYNGFKALYVSLYNSYIYSYLLCVSISGLISIRTFTKSVYEKHIEGADDAVKKAYKDGLNILNKIDKVNNVEELKKLFNENSDGAKGICSEIGQTPDEFLNNVTDKNLNENKKVIKDKINAGNNTRYRDIKNKIEACWDKDKKTFEMMEL